MKKIFLSGFALISLGLLTAGQARADVFGRLRLIAQESGTHPKKEDLQVTLRDTAGVRGDIRLTTGKGGAVLSPLLEDRHWQIVRVAASPKGPNLLAVPQTVLVAADTTTDVTLTADSAGSAIVGITEGGMPTALVYRRDQDFIHKYPVTAGDPQNLERVLQTVPRTSR